MKYFKILLAIIFLLCLLDMPYGYYQLVRLIGMISFVYFAYEEKDSKGKLWMFFWIGSALLINPLLKISLGRELWNVVDVIWALILFYQSKIMKSNNGTL